MNITDFEFTAWNSYERDGITHAEVFFVPAVTIDCNPPYIKGKKDSCWIKYRKRPQSKEELEGGIGMSILSWE